MSDCTGAAFALYEFSKLTLTEKYKLPDCCTVFQAEIKAILEAAKHLITHNRYKYVKFFIDSQAAILALDSNKITSSLVRDAKLALNKAAANRFISLNWTRAHVGTEGNECADQKAKEGGKTGIQSMIMVPTAELKSRVEELVYKRWELQWSEYNGARMAKLFYSKPNAIQAQYVLKLNRMELSRFLRLISGHNGLFYFRSKIDKDINPECRFCLQSDETFYHLVTDCPAFLESRKQIFLDEIPDANICLLYTSPSPRD